MQRNGEARGERDGEDEEAYLPCVWKDAVLDQDGSGFVTYDELTNAVSAVRFQWDLWTAEVNSPRWIVCDPTVALIS